MAKLTEDISEVHSIMTKNIQDVLNHGERLDRKCSSQHCDSNCGCCVIGMYLPLHVLDSQCSLITKHLHDASKAARGDSLTYSSHTAIDGVEISGGVRVGCAPDTPYNTNVTCCHVPAMCQVQV